MKKAKELNQISRPTNVLLNVIFSIYAFICLFPIVCVIIIAATDELSIVQNGYQIIPKQLSGASFEFLYANGAKIINAYGVTLFTTIAGTILSLLISAMFAFPISRRSFRQRNKLAFFVYFTMLFSGGTVPLYLVYTQVIPLKNSIWALILPNMVSGFNVLLMRTFFKNNIPDEIVEAAEIDGAGYIRIFFRMVLQLSVPVFAALGMLTALGYWNNYFRNMLFIYDDSVVNLQYLLFRLQSQIEIMQNPDFYTPGVHKVPSETARMAMVVVTIGPIALLYPFLQKYFIKGLTIGAVKG